MGNVYDGFVVAEGSGSLSWKPGSMPGGVTRPFVRR